VNLYAPFGRTYFPFHLRLEAVREARCVLRGPAPVGVAPSYVDANTRFFMTLGLVEGLDVSVYTSFDYAEPPSELSPYQFAWRLLSEKQPLIQFVTHSSGTPRDAGSPLSNEGPALGFVFGARGEDPECENSNALSREHVYEDHKVGGLPFFAHLEGDFGKAFDLLSQGYEHLMQLGFPGAEDSLLDGTWPFGGYVFHVFAKRSAGDFQFRCIWG
jgi:hypothetical protein